MFFALIYIQKSKPYEFSHKNLKINEVVERWWKKLNWNDALVSVK